MDFPQLSRPWLAVTGLTIADNPRNAVLKPTTRRLGSETAWSRISSPLRKRASLRRAKLVFRRDTPENKPTRAQHEMARRSQSTPMSWHLAVFRDKGFKPELAKQSTQMILGRKDDRFSNPVVSNLRRSMAWTLEDVPLPSSPSSSHPESLGVTRQRSLSDAMGSCSVQQDHLEAVPAEEQDEAEQEVHLSPDGQSCVLAETRSPGDGAAALNNPRDEWLWSPRVTITEPVAATLNDDYMEEESVSDEAHKRFLQELWAQSGLGESPPPIDLEPTHLMTRSNHGSTKRRVKSWFITSSSSDFRPENPAVARLKLTGEAQPVFGSDGYLPGGSKAEGGSLRGPLSATSKGSILSSSTSGRKRLGSSSRDRRVSVLGLPLFSSSSYSEDANRGMFTVTAYDQTQQRRNSHSFPNPKKGHAPLTATNSLPLTTEKKCLESSEDEEDEDEGGFPRLSKDKVEQLQKRSNFLTANGLLVERALRDEKHESFRSSGCEWMSTGSDDVFGSLLIDGGLSPDKNWFESSGSADTPETSLP